MHLWPTVDYKTPEPRKRIGFLTRLNPKASLWSVVRHACIMVVIAAALWGLALVFRPNPKWQPSWPFFVLSLCCAALTAAVHEWQVPDEDDERSPSK